MEAPFSRGDTSGDEIHWCLGWPSLAGSLVVSVVRILLPGPRTPGNMRGRRRCRASTTGACAWGFVGTQSFTASAAATPLHEVTASRHNMQEVHSRLEAVFRWGQPTFKNGVVERGGSRATGGGLAVSILMGLSGFSLAFLFRRGLPAAPATGLITTNGNIRSCSGSLSMPP